MRIMFMHSIKHDKTESESKQSTSIHYLHNLRIYVLYRSETIA